MSRIEHNIKENQIGEFWRASEKLPTKARAIWLDIVTKKSGDWYDADITRSNSKYLSVLRKEGFLNSTREHIDGRWCWTITPYSSPTQDAGLYWYDNQSDTKKEITYSFATKVNITYNINNNTIEEFFDKLKTDIEVSKMLINKYGLTLTELKSLNDLGMMEGAKNHNTLKNNKTYEDFRLHYVNSRARFIEDFRAKKTNNGIILTKAGLLEEITILRASIQLTAAAKPQSIFVLEINEYVKKSQKAIEQKWIQADPFFVTCLGKVKQEGGKGELYNEILERNKKYSDEELLKLIQHNQHEVP